MRKVIFHDISSKYRHIFINNWFRDRLKVDESPKMVKLIQVGKGFLNVVDRVFWHLPLANINQAHAVRERAYPPVSEEDWNVRFTAIKNEHNVEGAWE